MGPKNPGFSTLQPLASDRGAGSQQRRDGGPIREGFYRHVQFASAVESGERRLSSGVDKAVCKVPLGGYLSTSPGWAGLASAVGGIHGTCMVDTSWHYVLVRTEVRKKAI